MAPDQSDQVPRPSKLTIRQQLMEILAGARYSSKELASLLGIPERQVEEHLTHITRSLARDHARRFVMEPASCRECGFAFRERHRLTTPSRCPRCRSERITPPIYGIQL